MSAEPSKKQSNWDDLKVRVASGVAMLLVGIGAVMSGGIWFQLLVILVTVAMIWELWMMFAPKSAKSEERAMFAAYAFAVVLACWGLLYLRDGYGLTLMLWLISVVVVTDIAGYFAGRLIGGAKFWPSISPKKTWSGVIAGWICAGLLGMVFAAFTKVGIWIALVSIVLSFASQLGDIAESSLKRRAGVKDSSALIPGHGGVLDRFDGVLGATLCLLLFVLIFQIPKGLF